MNITIQNFGPISSITFDLRKDFHLIYGKNSIGKSYATYCLYCIIKNITKKRIPSGAFYYEEDEEYGFFKDKVKNAVKQIRSKKSDDHILNDIASIFMVEQLDKVLIPGIENSLKNTFSSLVSLKNGYSKKAYSFTFHLSNGSEFTIQSDKKGSLSFRMIDITNHWRFVEKNTKTTKYCLYDGPKIVFGRPTEDQFIESFHENLIVNINSVLEELDSDIRDIYYLPASRSGLYQALNSFTPILAELTQNRFFINSKKIELPSLSEPLSDYFIDISTINNSFINRQYKNIIENIENDILEGSIRYDDKAKKIKYKPNNLNLEIDIAEVSSMISELSPLVIYLRHILHHKFSSKNFYEYNYFRNRVSSRRYDIIFIEEPEAHLHPEIQVKLTRIFAELVKLNIKVIMTSHSNFMFNKTNNMIISKEIASNKIAVYHLIKTQNGSLVNPNMIVSEDGIADDNFAEISKKLYEERVDSLDGY